ncbi:MAG TPA: sodium:proton antiporter [Ignavibacteria bacterium]|nr:sodium:proton antiporter [Ignavibacteria bacterium]
MEIILFIPFILLLAAIAVMPFLFKNWWEENYGKFSLGLAMLVAIYYLVVLQRQNELFTALEDYFSFISLLGSLYIVSGGIYLKITGKPTPFKNSLILLAGSILANFIGTTGAAVLLIKPFIKYNQSRLKPYHIIFFIFSVCNTGGALTPIGDPPLLMGFLKGIPFFWTIGNIFHVWTFMILYILVIFYIIDLRNKKDIPEKDKKKKDDEVKYDGLFNIIFLVIIIGSVFITKPLFVREIIMLGCSLASYKMTSKEIRRRNSFSFEPIKEVALLFAGIFVTLMPVLNYLYANAHSIGISGSSGYYWSSGFLTSFLDNAPTYLNFMSLSMGQNGLNINNPYEVKDYLVLQPVIMAAISTASVFFGAMTYIGNGPNFLVKSIAEQKGIKMPGFFDYIYKYSVPVLLPGLAIIWLLFFK